nr:copper chaperone PCu(A)C [uncultured Cohaesibacter sp.]
MRYILVILMILTMPFGVWAQEHDAHSDHVSELKGFRVVHAWTRATSEKTALIFMELENESSETIVISGGDSEIASSGKLVGFTLKNGMDSWQDISTLPIQAHKELHFEPHGAALMLAGLTKPLKEGEMFEIHLDTSLGELEVHVEIENAQATHHSHAGHNH